MYIKKIALFIIMVTGIICNNACSVLNPELYKKKYSFSEPVLDETKALNYIIGKGENPEVVFKLMWEEAIQKNENIQLKLLLLFSDARFYNKAKQRMPNLLNDNSEYSLNSLIEMGVNQKKSWAFYEKAMIETNNKEKFILLNQANNYIFPQLSDSLLYQNIENERKKLIENILTNVIGIEHTEKSKIKINRFINQIIEYKYGSFLFFIYTDLKNKNIKNPDYSFACLKAASELDYVTACVERGNIFHLQNNMEAAYECFLKAAKMGEIGSMYNVGVILAAKEAILDKQKGLKWLLKAADGGEIDAMYYAAITLKELSKKQSNIQLDVQKTINLLCEASKKNHIDAMVKLGKMLNKEIIGKEFNPTEAAEWLLKAVQQKNPKAMYHYGLLLKKGFIGQEPNIKEGNLWIKRSATLNYEPAINYMGGLLMGWVKNEEQKPNQQEAYNWFLKAAETDNLAAFNAANMIGFGFRNIKPNRKKAIQILLKTAKNKQIDSMILLSRFYLREALAENNMTSYKNAALWLKQAEEYGCFDDLLGPTSTKLHLKTKIRFRFCLTNKDKIREIYNLACFYYDALIGDNQNKKEAFRLFLCAAKNDYVDAMYCVGDMLLDGFEGQESDPKEAVHWFCLAAENDHAPSMVKLAKLFICTPEFSKSEQTLQEALFWLRKAEALNETEARDYLEMCETLLNKQSKIKIDDDSLIKLVENSNKLQPILVDLGELKHSNEEDDSDTLENDVDEINVVFPEEGNNFTTLSSLSEVAECAINPQYKNPKSIRNHFREIGLLKKQQQNQEKTVLITLSAGNQFIVNMLCDNTIKNKNIDYNQLVNLFNDPYFENQVRIIRSKSGCVISAKNYKTLHHEATSTHKKHGQSYDGLNREFTKQLISILGMFGLGTEGK